MKKKKNFFLLLIFEVFVTRTAIFKDGRANKEFVSFIFNHNSINNSFIKRVYFATFSKKKKLRETIYHQRFYLQI